MKKKDYNYKPNFVYEIRLNINMQQRKHVMEGFYLHVNMVK